MGKIIEENTISLSGNDGKKWYIIHTYSGFERKVAEGLMNRVQMHSLQGKIGQILIPTEDVVEMKGGLM